MARGSCFRAGSAGSQDVYVLPWYELFLTVTAIVRCSHSERPPLLWLHSESTQDRGLALLPGHCGTNRTPGAMGVGEGTLCGWEAERRRQVVIGKRQDWKKGQSHYCAQLRAEDADDLFWPIIHLEEDSNPNFDTQRYTGRMNATPEKMYSDQ